MPLTLVTGPANSAKAQVVLERYRASLRRSPILVVPRAADAEHYRRELVESGVVLGGRVEPFSGLMREIARRAGVTERPLGDHAREAVITAVIEAAKLEALASAALAPSFASALARFFAELESRRIEPPRFTSALRRWAEEGSARRAYADELAALYGAYRRRLERLGRLDGELHAISSLDAISLAGERWLGTPVFCYGFDDLEPLQIDAIETLAHRVGTTVVVSLPGEPGRVALAGRASTLERLRPAADEVVELGAQDRYYEAPSLHHLERSLFEPGAPAPHGEGVALFEGGDARAEAELIAADIAALIAAGFAPEDIAIVARDSGAGADVITDALDDRDVAHTRTRRDRFESSSVGAGILALLRCAAGGGEAADLVAWLRAPGVVSQAGALEAFEARLRRRGVTDLAAARELWQRQHGSIDSLARLEEAGRSGGSALCDTIQLELDRLLAAPWRRAAALVEPWEGAAVLAARRALGELRELARTDPRLLGGLAGVTRALAAVTVEQPAAVDAAAVTIYEALSLRARRVRALFICGVQDRVFPAPAREESLLGSAERAELAQASGLVLSAAGDQLGEERYLFYALCSRPTARLRVSWHSAGDDGEPAHRSLFVDDLRDCFEAGLYDERAVRPAGSLSLLGEAGAGEKLERLARVLAGPRHRAPAIAALADPRNATLLRGRTAHSASGLESWAGCPVAWLIEHGLRARELSPDRIWIARGSEAHRVLASVFEGLRSADGSGRLDDSTLPLALELLEIALAEGTQRLSSLGAVDRAERRRLQLEIERFLTLAAESSSRFEPRAIELAFGVEGAELPAVEVGDGLLLCGRIDRVDVDAETGTAIVFDYKTGGSGVSGRTAWAADRKLQPALYMRAAERLLGVAAVGGLYQPLRDADLNPRGALLEDVVAAAPDPPARDRIGADELAALIDERILAAIEVAAEIERGAIEPRPATCASDGTCRYPTICRCEAS
jgi:ATP-dependent helicase/DNAse subunit B